MMFGIKASDIPGSVRALHNQFFGSSTCKKTHPRHSGPQRAIDDALEIEAEHLLFALHGQVRPQHPPQLLPRITHRRIGAKKARAHRPSLQPSIQRRGWLRV